MGFGRYADRARPKERCVNGLAPSTAPRIEKGQHGADCACYRASDDYLTSLGLAGHRTSDIKR